jgi:uncharacterized protein
VGKINMKRKKLSNNISAKAKKIFDQPKSERTLDGFQNFSARLGVAALGDQLNEDNLISKGHYEFNLLTRNRIQLEAAYRGSWIVGRVIDSVAEDMTRAKIDINTNEGADNLQDLNVQMSRLQIFQSVNDGIKWGRLYGGALGVLQINGQNLLDELDPDDIKEDAFKGIVIYDRWQLYPVLSKLIDSGPNMGLPAYYDIVLGANLNDPGKEPGGQRTDNPNAHVRVHHSRCVRFDAIKLPFYQAITEMMWGESVLERMWDRLIAFDTASASTAGLITRANLRTVGIDGLREILAAGGAAQEALVSQFEYMRQFQSSEGLTLIDKNDEFQTTAYSFAGLSDVLIQFGQQVSGSAEIPLVRLFGQSPAGLSATGESDLRNYYDSIKAKQEAMLRNPFETIIKVMWRSCFGEPAPADLTFEFTPLWQMSAMDKATIAKTNTDAIIEAHAEGLVDSATAMRELKQASGDNGLFTHITDEHIDESENEEPPAPDDITSAGINVGNPGGDPEQLGKAKAEQGAGEEPKPHAQDDQIAGFEVVPQPKTIWAKLKGIVKPKAKDSAPVNDSGIPGTMKEFYNGTLKSGSGKKVTSKKQALAIGYSEEGKDEKKEITDHEFIKDWLSKRK